MRPIIDVSHELLLCRYLNGFRLMSREDIASRHPQDLLVTPISPVADLMKLPFSVFFLADNSEFQELNETCWQTINFLSKSDAIGRTIAKVVREQSQAKQLIANNKEVITKKQLRVFDESVDLRDGSSTQGVSFKVPLYGKNSKPIGIFGCAAIIYQHKLYSIAKEISTISNLLFPSNMSARHLLMDREVNGKYFSAREIEVTQHLVRGKTIREIALTLGLKDRTVESYFNNIKSKVGVQKKSQLIQYFTQKE